MQGGDGVGGFAAKVALGAFAGELFRFGLQVLHCTHTPLVLCS